jgi:hypothetical protein
MTGLDDEEIAELLQQALERTTGIPTARELLTQLDAVGLRLIGKREPDDPLYDSPYADDPEALLIAFARWLTGAPHRISRKYLNSLREETGSRFQPGAPELVSQFLHSAADRELLLEEPS